MKLERSDRRLLIWAGVFIVLVMIALSFTQDEEESSVPSTYSAQSRGAKGAFLLLQESGYRVERWEQAPLDLPANPQHTVLVMASPYAQPTRDEQNALQTFLSEGGKVLVTGRNVPSYLPKTDVEREPLQTPSPKEYKPQLLTPLTRGGAIQMSPAAYWKGQSAGTLVHYADEDRPIVVSYNVGHGEVIWWASSTPLTNAAIDKSGNLALLLNSIGDDKDVRILWDEYFHSEGSSLSAYLFDPPAFWGLAQCLLVFLALIFTFSRRSGPIHPLPEPSRLSPLEFVSMLGKLYRRANAVHSALEIPYARFRTLAARRLGLSPDISAEDLANSVKIRLRYKDDSLRGLLLQIESALHNPELKEDEALALVKELDGHIKNLKLISTERQENPFDANRVTGAHARTN